jgi:hypothetical protein
MSTYRDAKSQKVQGAREPGCSGDESLAGECWGRAAHRRKDEPLPRQPVVAVLGYTLGVQR